MPLDVVFCSFLRIKSFKLSYLIGDFDLGGGDFDLVDIYDADVLDDDGENE